jgi:hypothetical protein
MFNKKIIIMSFSMLCVMQTYAMDKLGGDDQGLQQTGALALYSNGWIPSSDLISKLVGVGLNVITANANSAYVTATNYISNDAALAKLGYPPTNDVNNAELAKSIAILQRHRQDIAANNIISADFKNDADFINRRQGYIQRALTLLLDRQDGVELAAFCLKNYQSVMNSFEIARFFNFVQSKKESSANRADAIAAEVNSLLVSEDSPMLRSAMQQLQFSGSAAQQNQETFEEKKQAQ